MRVVRSVAILVVAFAVLLGALLLTGWLLTHPLRSSVGGFDNQVARDLAAHRNGTLTDLADVGTLAGETLTGVIVLVVVGVGFSLWRRSWRPGLFVLAMYAGMGAFYYIATHVDPRPRPPVKILDPGLNPEHSFPSGHTGTAASIALCLAILLATYVVTSRPWLALLALLPLFTAASRLYLGAHHVTDVVTALVLAPLWATVVASQVLAPEARARGPRVTA